MRTERLHDLTGPHRVKLLLVRQAGFEAIYRSINIGDIRDREFDLVVISGVQTKKW